MAQWVIVSAHGGDETTLSEHQCRCVTSETASGPKPKRQYQTNIVRKIRNFALERRENASLSYYLVFLGCEE